MELKPTCQETGIGVMLEDWEEKPLGKFLALRRGHDLTAHSRKPGDIPVMGSAGLNGYHDTALVKGPGVVLGRSGASFGQAHYCADDFWPHNTSLYVTDFFGNDRLFVFYFLQSIDFSRHNSGGAQQSLNRNFIAPILIRVPPVNEQKAIAEALRDAVSLIESLEQLIAKKRHLKRGTMQELLRPKDGWVRRTLAQIVEIRSGGTPSTTRRDYWDGDILWCTPTDITALSGFKYLTNTNRTITKLGLKSSSAELIPANSIVMTSRATIGECAINLVPVSTNQGFKNFIPREGTNVDFLYYLLLTKTQDFIGLCGGSTFLEIGKAQLATFELALPTNEADEVAIAQVLSDMDAEIAALEAKLVKVRQIKQGMMHNLLTGKIRLV